MDLSHLLSVIVTAQHSTFLRSYDAVHAWSVVLSTGLTHLDSPRSVVSDNSTEYNWRSASHAKPRLSFSRF
jgi:hypothetical protein